MTTPAHPDQLLTTEQLAEYLEVSPRTLEDWRYKAEGPHFIPVGPRFIRYRASDVQAWLDSRAAA